MSVSRIASTIALRIVIFIGCFVCLSYMSIHPLGNLETLDEYCCPRNHIHTYIRMWCMYNYYIKCVRTAVAVASVKYVRRSEPFIFFIIILYLVQYTYI